MAQLLGVNLSPFVRKVLLYVNEAGIELEHDDSVLPMPKTDALLAINPRGKIPAYRDEDISLGESSVICAYLEKKHGPSGLYPEDPVHYGMALWYEKYMEEELVAAIGKIFFNRVAAPMLGVESDESAVADGIAMLPPMLELLEERLESRFYLVGAKYSIADVSIMSPFASLYMAKESVDAKLYPNLVNYLQNLEKRESVAKTLAMSGATFS
ncbi:MAG: glutathione S-transferase family protein [Pseudomonadales bacterium]